MRKKKSLENRLPTRFSRLWIGGEGTYISISENRSVMFIRGFLMYSYRAYKNHK